MRRRAAPDSAAASPPGRRAGKPKHVPRRGAAPLVALAAGTALAAGFTLAALLPASSRPPPLRRLPGPRVAGLPQFGGDWASARLWGTYRSGAYVGLRTRAPRGLVAGAAWFDPDAAASAAAAAAAAGQAPAPVALRHEAQERDGLRTFGWVRHDGEAYGHQLLADAGAALTVTWVKRAVEGVAGGDWAVRVAGEADAPAAAAHAAATAAARAAGEAPPPPLAKRVSLLFYVGDEAAAAGVGEGVKVLPPSDGGGGGGAGTPLAAGDDATVGGWRLTLAGPRPPSLRHVGHAVHALHNVSAWLAADLEEAGAAPSARGRARGVRAGAPPPFSLPNAVDGAAPVSLAAFQVMAELPFSFDFVFVGGVTPPHAAAARPRRRGWFAPPDAVAPDAPAAPPSTVGAPPAPIAARVAALSGAGLDAEAATRAAAFDERFERTFPEIGADPSLPAGTPALAKAALSNLLGGMAYFYGAPRVRLSGRGGRDPVVRDGAATPLFTATPARAFFPRGFLWDEGFHQLIVLRWSRPLARDAVAHWVDAVTASGWIPREQILGAEAEARVPPEFVAQSPDAANPPTLLLPLADMARRCERGRQGGGAADAEDIEAECEFLRAAYPRVKAWIDWLLATQTGAAPHSFAWRGRDPGAGGGRELNPKTLTSGLDDYPRASHPSPAHDRHVDLLAWAALATRLLAAVGRGAGRPAGEVAGYAARAAALGDVRNIAGLHWVEGGDENDAVRPGFYDYGLHTDAVALAWRYVTDDEGTPVDRVLVRRVASSDPPVPRHVTSARGVVGLFPLMLRLLPADSPQLAASLDLVRELACPAGIASLAPDAALRDAHNTEHDAPYWRGAAWPPLTYLTLAALNHYARAGGPHAAAAAALRDEVRAAFVGNVVARATESGGVCDVWERYKGDETGEGMGPRPFTGWGATVVLAAAGAWFDM